MFPWAVFYLCLALPTAVISVLSRRRKFFAAGTIIMLSWVMTNVIVFTDNSDNHHVYLSYFFFDMVAAYVLMFMLLHRFTWWNAAFLLATCCQLVIHVCYWQFGPPPRRYHELLNAFYWVQMAATWLAIYFSRRPPVRRPWLPPRRKFEPKPCIPYQPRTVPGDPRECPLQLRMWA